ncbi:M42 family metallopeptidase [Paenibacillus sp. UNC451MF]|uniref:M42 family metallopeptidase n=1 Tax=Paenibacillus sp. UNC451MF TaxID=1449063 RepID=UPI00048BB70B|nr:M42 family metallopeptidase [Paenibacillus sp. UNC451MF]
MEKTLNDLCSLTGPSGFEHEVARYIVGKIKDKADEFRVDGLGNVIAIRKGSFPGPKLIVSAHMDEVGFIVKKIQSNGLIRFEKLGGHDDRILLAQKVRIATEKGPVLGVIGTISAHMAKYDDIQKVRKHSELYIDAGVSSREEALELGIRVGDPIVWATEVERIGTSRLVGKAFDDRAGCAVLLKAFEEIDFSQVHGEVCFVFSVQEEVGLRGATTAGRQFEADVALAVDTTAVSDTPEAMMDQTLALGQGVGIKVMDFSLIASLAVRKKLVRLAEQNGITHQLEVFPGIGTDGGALSTSGAGVPTGVLSIPSRYAHSAVELIDLNDLEHTNELLKAFILDLRDPQEFGFIS